MSIARFSVRNPVLANMLTIVVVVWGVVVALTLEREVFPEADLDLVVIRTVYPNASPEEVEDLITNPIEEELREVEEIDEYTSSSVEGMSVVVAQMDPDARNLDRAINDIQRKVDQVRDLPEEAEDPVVTAITTAQPVINVCVYGDGTVDERVLRDYGETLRSALERIEGVSTVTRTGWRDEEVQVRANLEALRENELTLGDLTAALARRNINLPGGKYRAGDEEIVLRTVGKFATVEEILGVVVRSNIDGKHVTVGDLAAVSRGFQEDATYAKANGARTLVYGVKKKARGDSIDIADEVKRIVADQQTARAEGVQIALVDDVSFYVKRRLHVLQSNGLIGIVLVVICLFLFLNFRVAVFTAFGIPFAFLATLILMSQYGMTINLMTMFGLIIVLGMVVDDAIIVGENTYRHLEEGMDPKSAAVKGADEVMYPVIATILTTIAAFLPLAFAPDMFGKYLQWLVWVVVFALLASLFEVLFILPSHIADFTRPVRAHRGNRKRGHAVMHGLTAIYRSSLRLVLNLRYLFLFGVGLCFLGSAMLARQHMHIDMFPADLIDVFFVRVTTRPGMPLAETDKRISAVENRIRALPEDELEDIVSYLGTHFNNGGASTTRGSHRGQIVAYLTPQNLRARKTAEIIDELREACQGLPGISELEFEMVNPGPPVGKPLEMRVSGHDFGVLQEISEQMQAFLRGRAGMRDISDDFEQGKRELHVVADEAETARLGLSVQDVAFAVFTAVEGAEATMIREGKEEVEVRVMLDESWQNERDLGRLPLRNRMGRDIDLSRVAGFEHRMGLPAISHYNGDRVITVGAHVDTEVTSSAAENRALFDAFRDVPVTHPGYQLIEAGEWKETKKLVDFMMEAFLVASLLIYTILAVQFSSFLQPLILLSAIPLGVVGVILALILHQKPVSIMAMMGMVGLAGVVVNDAIVLVSFINDRRRSGMPTVEAIVEAGIQRFRPILLTSVTTIAGLMPVIYGWGGYEPFIAPAAIALAYGLFFASFLTLMVVPSLYLAAIDVKTLARRLRHPRGATSTS